MAPVLGYWPARGLTNHIRLLLEHVGEKYEMELQDGGWFEKKYQLGLPFPNLPFLKDGKTALTQSDAILRYFARKHNLVAKTEEEYQQQDVLTGVTADLRNAWAKLMYMSTDFDAEKLVYRKDTLVPVLQSLEKFLGTREYLVGTDQNRLTYVDFVLFELLDINSQLFPDLLNEFAGLKKYHERIGNLKGVKEFMASDRLPVAINGPTAKFAALKM